MRISIVMFAYLVIILQLTAHGTAAQSSAESTELGGATRHSKKHQFTNGALKTSTTKVATRMEGKA